MRIICIVEGHGDVDAVPVLLRRLAVDLLPGEAIDVARPFRIPRTKLVKDGELERVVELAARGTSDRDAIVVLLDADTDCPAKLGSALLTRARDARGDRTIRVVLAKHEFETWFLAAAESLGGQRGLASDLSPPSQPESVADAKGWLTAHRTDKRAYRETIDQPALAALFDLSIARSRSRSFRKLCGDLATLSGLTP